MSPEQIVLIRQGWGKIAPIANQAVEVFYEKLFAIDPELRALFGGADMAAQRVKLAKELSKRATGRTLYILDEPTTGLHFDDIKKLVDLMHELADQGNTVLVIEHNMDIIKNCDHIIDLGPDGGVDGGEIVATGTPEQVSKISKSITGQFLK